MKLKDKGPIVKPPTLKGPAQKVSLEIQSWPEMIAATHWTIGDSTRVNGADFYLEEKELGHIHLDGEVHLKLTKALRKTLIENGLAEAFPWGDEWVQFQIADSESAKHAQWLFRLGYDRLRGFASSELQDRISQQSTSEPPTR